MTSIIHGDRLHLSLTPIYPRSSSNHRSSTGTSPSSASCSCYYCAVPRTTPLINPPTTGGTLTDTEIFNAVVSLHRTLTPRPFIFHDVDPSQWKRVAAKFSERFKTSKFEYTTAGKMIVVPLAKPFHDFAVPLMGNFKIDMLVAGLDTPTRIQTLNVNRRSLAKASGSEREANCAMVNKNYVNGVVPTIIWEVGHTQKRSSLYRRAKMWCRRYNGMVRAVILVKYQRKNPLLDNSAILMVYRPEWQSGKWRARQHGPVSVLFPRPEDAGGAADTIPLTYEDYFGPGNWGIHPNGQQIDPNTPFPIPLETVRAAMRELIGFTIHSEQYRYVSGGSSVASAGHDAAVFELDAVVEMERHEREDSPVEEYEEYSSDWDRAYSELSDA